MSAATEPAAAPALSAARAAAAYAERRADHLLDLLADVESWRVIHRHALEQAAQHPPNSEQRLVLGRLAQVATDLADLADSLEGST